MSEIDKSVIEIADLRDLGIEIRTLKRWIAALQQTVNQIHYMIEQGEDDIDVDISGKEDS